MQRRPEKRNSTNFESRQLGRLRYGVGTGLGFGDERFGATLVAKIRACKVCLASLTKYPLKRLMVHIPIGITAYLVVEECGLHVKQRWKLASGLRDA